MQWTRNSVLAALGATLIALSGAAYAAGDNNAAEDQTGSPPAVSEPQNGGAEMQKGAEQGASEEQQGTESAAKPATPPESIVGQNVMDSSGQEVGKVSKVVGDQVIVSTGGFLGIGARDVAIPWSDITMKGTGEHAQLETSMSLDQIKNLPAYKEE